MNENTFLKSIIDLLAYNKQFPAYQAERRIDIFINLFLENILEAHYLGSKATFIAPEFPLKTLVNYQSTKADYLCQMQDGPLKELIFVELKTDRNSFNLDQYKNYLSFPKWSNCLKGISEIILRGTMGSVEKAKYFHLIKTLYKSELIQVSLPMPSEYSRNFNQFIRSVRTDNPDLSVKLLYIAPEAIRESKEWKKAVPEPLLLSFERISTYDFIQYREEWNMIKALLKGF